MSGRSLKFGGFGRSGGLGSQQGDRKGPNVSKTPITAMECRQCLPLSVVQLKSKHCRKPHCRNGVLDTFRQSIKAYIAAVKIQI